MDGDLIIRNRANLPRRELLAIANVVTSKGRISDGGKCYCYVVTFKDGIACAARRGKNSDILDVWRMEDD